MKNEPHLVSVKVKGKFPGRYKCSLCDTEFKPHPSDQGAMTHEFNAHIASVHAPKKRTPREDVNQAAARVVREATER